MAEKAAPSLVPNRRAPPPPLKPRPMSAQISGTANQPPPVKPRPAHLRSSLNEHSLASDSSLLSAIKGKPLPPVKPKYVTQALSVVNQNVTIKKPALTEKKRRLEITVLDARPMSEVGFRDSTSSNHKTTGNNVPKMITPKPIIHKPVTLPVTNELSGTLSQNGYATLQESNTPTETALISATVNSSLIKNISTASSSGNRNSSPVKTRPTIIRALKPSSTANIISKTNSELLATLSSVTSTTESQPSVAAKSHLTIIKSGNTRTTESQPAVTKSRPTIIKAGKQLKPNILPLKRDPWAQIAKGPGPTDNLAFSTGDTPPPKPSSFSCVPILNQETSTLPVVNEDVSLLDLSSPISSTSSEFFSEKPSRPKTVPSLDKKLAPPPRPSTSPKRSPVHQTDAATEIVNTSQPSQASLQHLPSHIKEHHLLHNSETDGSYAVAQYDYVASGPEELTFQSGDIIKLVQRVNSDWLVGSTHGHQGMFPESFVDIRVPLPADMETVVTSKVTGPRCVARFDFAGDSTDDLTFCQGDVIQLLERVGDDWWKGQLQNHIGLFPTAFIEVIEDLPTSNNTEIKHSSIDEEVKAVALFDYIAQESSDLTFLAHTEIKVTRKVDSDWLFGEAGEKSGLFPVSFVKIISGDLAKLPVNGSTPCQCGSALYDFTADNDSELSFKAGDRITDIRQHNADWSEGNLGTHSGLFPSTFVKLDNS